MPTYDLTSSKTGRTYQVDFASDPTPEDVDYAINFFDAEEPAAPAAEQPGFGTQLYESFAGGGGLALGGGRTSLGVLTGDVPGMAAGLTQMQQAQARLQASQTPEDVAFAQDIAQQAQEMEQAEGILPTLREAVDLPLAVVRRPGAALRTAVQSLPNVAITTPVTLAGGLAGAALGTAGSPVGSIVGAVATGGAANAAIEVGYALNDLLNERTGGASATMTEEEIAAYLEANPDIVDEAQRIGLTRGATIGAVEALGLKGAGRLTAAPARAAEQAARTALAREGVDLASRTAVREAMATPALRQAAETAAKAATDQFNLPARALGAVGIEAGAAAGGELAAQAAAGQELDFGEAFLETLGEGLGAPASVLGARQVELLPGGVLQQARAQIAQEAVASAAEALGDEFPDLEELTRSAGPEAATEVAAAVTQAGAVADPVVPEPVAPAQPAPVALAQPTAPADVFAAAEQATMDWDRANRGNRSDEWFAQGKALQNRAFTEAGENAGADQLQAHGVAKVGTLTEGLRSVIGLLQNGIDPNRGGGRLDTAQLALAQGQVGSVGATASGTAYRDGPFILVQSREASQRGIGIRSPNEIAAVLVNDANLGQLDAIRAAIQAVNPNVIVAPYSEVANVSRQILNAPAQQSLPAVEAQAEATGQQPAIQTPDETEIPEASGLPPVQSQPPVAEAAVNLEEGAALGGGQGQEGQVTAEQLSAIPVGQTYTDPTGGVWTRRENQFGEPVLVTQSEGGQIRLSPQDVVAMVRRATAPTQPQVSPATGTVPTESLPADTQPTSGDVGTVGALRAVANNTATPEQLDALTQQGLARVVQGQPVITDAGLAMLPSEERPGLTEAERVAEIQQQTQDEQPTTRGSAMPAGGEAVPSITEADLRAVENRIRGIISGADDARGGGIRWPVSFRGGAAGRTKAPQFATVPFSSIRAMVESLGARFEESSDPNIAFSSRVEADGSQVILLNPRNVAAQILASGVPEEDASEVFGTAFYEEIVHLADDANARADWAALPEATRGGFNVYLRNRDRQITEEIFFIVRQSKSPQQASQILSDALARSFNGYRAGQGTTIFPQNVFAFMAQNERASSALQAEFIRQMVQQDLIGTTTEVAMFRRFIDRVLAALDRLISYVSATEAGAFGDTMKARLQGTKDVLLSALDQFAPQTINTPSSEIQPSLRPLTGDAQRNETLARRRRGAPTVPTGLRTIDGAPLSAITVTTSQATQARAIEAAQTPGAQDTWIGTSEEYLAENPDAAFVADNPTLEAFYDPAVDRAVILTDRVQVREGDAVRAARNGTSAALEAVRRLIRHESFVHRGWRALPSNLKNEFLSISENVVPADDLDQLAKIYKRFANWRNDSSIRALAVEEWLAQRLERIEKLPAGSDSVLNQLVDWAKRVWQWLAGDDSVEPTRRELVDLMRQMVRALETGEREQAMAGIRASLADTDAEYERVMERYKGQRSTETTAQKRTYSPIVRDLLERRESGEQISEAVLQRAIEEYFPSYQVPVPKSMADLPSQQTVLDAITQDKKTAHQEAMQKGFPKDGSPITVRQDVPAMTQYGVGVVTTRTDSGTFYLPAARFTEPKFGMNERQNIKIAKGEAKGPYFFIKGKWSQDQTMPGDLENWTQVGFNPDRHSYYYERGTSRQVVGGKEAYQVGNTVFVKDAVFGKEGGALRFSLTGNEAEIEQIIREDRDDAESGVVPTRARPLAPSASPTSATEQLGPRTVNGKKIDGQEIIERNRIQESSTDRTQECAIEIVNKLGPMDTWLSTLLNPAWQEQRGFNIRSPLGQYVVAEALTRVSNASVKDRLRYATLNDLLARQWQTGATESATNLAFRAAIIKDPRYAALFAVQAMIDEQRKRQAGIIDPALGSTEATVEATRNADTEAQQQATEDVDSELRLKDMIYDMGLAAQDPEVIEDIKAINENVFRVGVLMRLRQKIANAAAPISPSMVEVSASAVEAEYAGLTVEQIDALINNLNEDTKTRTNRVIGKAEQAKATRPRSTTKTVVEQAKDLIAKLEAAPGVKKTPKPNPVRDLYKAHLKQPMAEGDFVRAMVGAGVPEADAAKLYELAAVKIAAAEATKVAGRTARLMDRETSSLENLINKLRPKITGGLNWREIFDRPLSNQREWRQQLFDTLRADPALANLSPAEVRDLAAEIDRVWNTKREAAFKALAKRMNLPGAREGVKEKIAESAPALIRYINSGAFNDVNFRNAIADKFGVPQLDEARVDEVIALVQKAQEAKTQVERNKFMVQAIRLMQEGMKAELGEVISNYWVTSVLSGFATLFDMAMSVLNGARVMTQFSADAIIRQRDFKLAGRAAKNYFQSLGNAILESTYYFVSGDPSMLDNYQFTLNTYLREGSAAANPFDYFERIIKDPSKPSWAKIVPYYFAGLQRLMTAFDHINSTSTAQGTLEHALAYNRKLFGDARMPSQQDVAAARAKAVQLAGGDRTFAQKRKVTAYTRQILNEEFNKTYPGILDEAKDIGRIAAYQNDPTGIGGLIYHTLLGLTNKAVAAAGEFRDEGRARGEAQGIVSKFMREFMYILAVNSRNISGTRFVRFVGNRVNELISFTPGAGFLRLYEKDTSPTRRAMLLQNQAVGILLGVWVTATLLRMMGDEEDDEKRGFRISGSWQGLTPDRKNQLRANNMTPNSVQIWDGEKWVNFNYTPWPVASLLATVGNLADMKKYHPERWGAKEPLDRILAAAWAGAFSFKDLSAISGFMDMFGASAYSGDPVDSAVKWLGKFSSNYVGGVVPRMLKDIDMIMDPKARKPTDISEHFAKELPFYRRTEAGGERMYNIFGEQVELNRLPWRRVVTASRPEKEYQILAELNNRGLFLGVANPDNRTVGYGASRRELTDEEAERYAVETGKRYRQFVLDQGERLLEMDENRAKDFIARRTEALRNAALRDAIRTQP